LRSAHSAADGASAHDKLSPSRTEDALAAIAKAYTEPLPPQISFTEALPLRQDLADRAARLELAQGNPQAALTWTARGLALSTAPGVFRANLLLTSADAHEAMNQPDAARAALLQALEVNQQLLDRELENP